MNPKVSIVVPIYKVEKYLAQCVDSLLCQTLTDVEIILVDDGSPDRCGDIADCYARKDNRVKVIHQKNMGLGPARNTGIRAATGEYIGFVDSDDWVRPEMYQRLYDTAVQNRADIVVGGHCDLSDGKVKIKNYHPLEGTTLRTHDQIMEVRKNLYGLALHDKRVKAFPMAVWTSLYRRKMILNNSVFFLNIMSEDIIFNIDIYPFAKVISYTADTDYCYRKEGQPSITKTFSQEKKQKFVELMQVLREKAENEGDEDCILRAKRKAIDCHRTYIALVDESGIPFHEKIRHAKSFVEDPDVISCSHGYPVDMLPLKQRIFQMAVMNKYYGAVLILNWLHQKGKQCRIAIYKDIHR